jgi:tRNA threonylcarbamoyladenosine biosynthesis protein TsaB
MRRAVHKRCGLSSRATLGTRVKLLALDASTECCSVALMLGADMRLRETLTDRGHAELILPYVHSLLADAGVRLGELDGIAIGRGPGAFTGLRIAAGVAQGLAFAAGLRIATVSSLAAVAERVPAAANEPILVCNDARMGEVYWGHYIRAAAGSVCIVGEERVGPPEVVLSEARARHAAGNGLARFESLRGGLAARGLQLHSGVYPRADAVARLGAAEIVAGRALPPEAALPSYVRDEVATPGSGRVTPLQ